MIVRTEPPPASTATETSVPSVRSHGRDDSFVRVNTAYVVISGDSRWFSMLCSVRIAI